MVECLCLGMGVCVHRPMETRDGMDPLPLETELQAFAIHLTQVLGTEFRSYGESMLS